MSSECGVRVVCRFRPLNEREKNKGEHMSFLEFDPNNTSVTVSYNNKKDQFSKSNNYLLLNNLSSFSLDFDKIFGGEEAAAAAEGREVSACTQVSKKSKFHERFFFKNRIYILYKGSSLGRNWCQRS